MEEQLALFEHIQANDKTDWDAPRAMNPSPKTLLLGDDEPCLRYEFGQESLINASISKANNILGRHLRIDDVDLCNYTSITMAAIQYASPNGRFPAHIDHCNGSFVYLMSLGCAANFMVKGPGMECKKTFKFNSGDLLVFNASTEAAILHEVVSIVEGEESCPEELGNIFPVLRKNRYGVQCRVHL
mmetsp:Transcript_61538/g.166041  ORF Transcript_61538/g.166041 Transcript_61538/m.166041 type:complete len:186 (+) Transcript_61538:131-688(+)